jgi:hypothetical protein
MWDRFASSETDFASSILGSLFFLVWLLSLAGNRHFASKRL